MQPGLLLETGYRDLKTAIRGPGRILRSRSPAGITQEIWALLCACQLTCAARTRAAAAAGHDPDRISATVTLRAIRRAITTPAPPAAITAETLTALLPPRRDRSYPRLTRASTTARRAARTGLTGHVTRKITIITPDLPAP